MRMSGEGNAERLTRAEGAALGEREKETICLDNVEAAAKPDVDVDRNPFDDQLVTVAGKLERYDAASTSLSSLGKDG